MRNPCSYGYLSDQRLGASAVAGTLWALARARWTFSRATRFSPIRARASSAVPGAAIQLQPSAHQGFSFRESLVVREKRGQAEEGLRIATLAEVDGFLEGLLSLGRLSQAHVG